jgi:hypothetical protein
MPGNWLPITDYSAKHKISVSTLRRRIKADDIPYRFIDGKYWLLDEPATTHSPAHRPSLSETFTSEPAGQTSALKNPPPPSDSLDGPILSAANRLLTELKKAYTQILQEKEEQILQLREEVTDLKTLVRVLEGENDKLSARATVAQMIPQRDLDI